MIGRVILLRFATTMVVATLYVPVAAQVINDPRLFGENRSCEAYEDFLERPFDASHDDGPSLSDCHPLESFIIQNSQYPDDIFLSQFASVADDDSALRKFIELNRSLRRFDLAASFVHAELAGRHMPIKLAASQDIERAAVFAQIAGQIQFETFYAMCEPNHQCETLPETAGLEFILGEEFSYLEGVDSIRLAMCLNRVDGYTVPIRQVFQSRAFETCVQTQS